MIRIVILTVALLAGGGAAWLVYGALSGGAADGPVAAAPAEIATTAVLVAAAPINRGETLGPGNLEWQDWPEAVVSDAAIRRDTQPDAIETYTDWTSRAGFLQGEPIRPERLVDGSGGLMSVLLSPGKRAVAMPISAESGAGGFVMPDDRVDLVHTVVRDAGEPISTTIISNVRVLAVDQMSETAEDGAAKVASTATLELTPEQVETLSNARNSGRLSLALRSVADFDEVQPEEVVAVAPEPPAPEPAMAAAPGPDDGEAPLSPARIRIIGSGNVETLEVDRREG
ncbi:MAG TPA: Flp pilus assembly protein CpaB [Thermohalobaculum sp.]|nr:Flp pilus assembly protein CpaB [Thermohalobaculum sp.]